MLEKLELCAMHERQHGTITTKTEESLLFDT